MALKAQQRLKHILTEYFQDLHAPVAWCTSAGPAELLRAFGFTVYFPENHGALLGASRTAMDYIPIAHQAGYGAEVCSYLTSDIGAWIKRETPLTAAYGLKQIPTPDLIVYNTNQCREVAEWFNYFGNEFHCPVFGIHPPRHLEEISQTDIDAVVRQLLRLIQVCEQVTGQSLEIDKLSEAVGLSKEGSVLWRHVLETALHSPSPITFFDGCILMAPIVVLRGSPICNDFYRELLVELEARLENGDAAVPNESVRLFWDGMPIWGRLRAYSELFVENAAAVVASTYCNSWILDDLDPKAPLESMAYAYTQIFINRGENAKLRYLKAMADRYNVHGVIFHDAKTCFNNSNNRFGLPRRFQEETGIDTLIIDGDLNDLRFLSDGQTRTKLETFLEQIAVS